MNFAKSLLACALAGLAMGALADAPAWWNNDWTKRGALTVEYGGEEDWLDAVVDARVDFGESVVPREVRVVDADGTVLPCVVEPKGGTAFDLLFRTGFTAGESRDFEVYWGNASAPVLEVPANPLLLEMDDKEVRLANGAVEAVFDACHSTVNLMKSFRYAGSDAASAFLMRPSGSAWQAFYFNEKSPTNWSPVAVLADNALKKSIVFTNLRYRVEFTSFTVTPAGFVVGLHAAKIDADGQLFILRCKTDLASSEIIEIHARMQADKNSTAGHFTTIDDISSYDSLFILGIEAAE